MAPALALPSCAMFLSTEFLGLLLDAGVAVSGRNVDAPFATDLDVAVVLEVRLGDSKQGDEGLVDDTTSFQAQLVLRRLGVVIVVEVDSVPTKEDGATVDIKGLGGNPWVVVDDSVLIEDLGTNEGRLTGLKAAASTIASASGTTRRMLAGYLILGCICV
ncbi:uncharacterized protein JN550_007700 [Neoarthrinium moseri]|uniref:uncharacterized protein n=1 Tax=Neoarthrinium moseri TaxID=1658444 RepID=UPI001FDEA2CC|nr:uncharacterized protein JN550_007700 [Neoarthrinium moseri]KAI1866312.1 hypothetical protein JN550_007700 [Neoarthrinium moseri]